MIRIKRVYDPAEPDDGVRVLCTRLWPRGIRKTAVERWLPELGTPNDLREPWLAGRMSHEEFEAGMRAALKTPQAEAALGELAGLVRSGQTLTLLTSVKDLCMTHLTLVQSEIEARVPES